MKMWIKHSKKFIKVFYQVFVEIDLCVDKNMNKIQYEDLYKAN